MALQKNINEKRIMQCKYVKRFGSRCNREALPNSEKGYCLLHEDWEHKDEEETKKEFYRELEEGTTDFEGCILAEIDLNGRMFAGNLNFRCAEILRSDNKWRRLV